MVLSADADRLDGLVAVVTGGGSGIGQGIALGLHAFGADIAVWERDAETGAAVAASADGLAVTTDVRDTAAVDAALAETLDRYGKIDILVNNVGGVFWKPFLETSENGFDALHRVNLRQTMICTQKVALSMVERSLPGSVINLVSYEAVRAAPGYAAYAASKAGIISFTKTAALELAGYGIRVNAIAPDITTTPGIEARMTDSERDHVGLLVPMGRPGHVDEVAGTAVFLASSLSSYVTGQTIHVDGGNQASSGWSHRPDGEGYVYGPL